MSVSIGVVGTGSISKFHLSAFADMQAPVCAVADVNRASAETVARRFGADDFGEWEKVVSHPRVNLVTVFTPTSLHYPIAKAALENGKHVICEKTLTLDPARSLELGRLAQARGLILYTSYMKRFFPAARKAKELMPRLGHIMSVYCRTYQGGRVDMHTGDVPAAFRPGPDGITPIKRLSGGGILICGGSHVFDLLLHLVGKPSAVFARQFVRPGYDVDFMTHALLDLPEGGNVHFEANWHPLKKVGFEGRGWDEGFEINGVNGRLVLQTPVWNQPEHNAARLRHYDNQTEVWTEYAFDIVCPFAEAERHFLTQIEKGQQGVQDAYTGYRTDLLLARTAESARRGERLALEWEE